jgi:S1/P1 Nuclease
MQKGLSALILALCGAIAMPAPATAWDYPGHRIVGAIADLVLQQHYPKTRRRVSALLDLKDGSGNVERRTLSEVAVFPDCAKDEEEYCRRKPSPEEINYVSRNPEHKSFHFTNGPLELTQYRRNGFGTSDTDIVQMIGYAVEQLNDPPPPSKKNVKLTDTEAVWLLAHLLGDIHQPLHVGAVYFDKDCEKVIDPNAPTAPPPAEIAATFGGNRIDVVATAPAVSPAPNLHLFWDGAAVTQAMQAAGVANAEQDFAKMLATTPPAGWETPGAPETWAEAWVAEIMPLAREAHTRLMIRKSTKPVFPSGKTSCRWETALDQPYQDWAKGQVRIQLATAGFRLAAVLKAIFE